MEKNMETERRMIALQSLPGWELITFLTVGMKIAVCDRNHDLFLAVNMKTGSGML